MCVCTCNKKPIQNCASKPCAGGGGGRRKKREREGGEGDEGKRGERERASLQNQSFFCCFAVFSLSLLRSASSRAPLLLLPLFSFSLSASSGACSLRGTAKQGLSKSDLSISSLPRSIDSDSTSQQTIAMKFTRRSLSAAAVAVLVSPSPAAPRICFQRSSLETSGLS